MLGIGLSTLLGAGLGAVGNLAGGAIGAHNSLKMLEYQNQYNREMADLQWQRYQDAWNKENAYNSPAQQVQRLKEAGLNPALMYGSGSASVGNSSHLPSPPSVSSERVDLGDYGVSAAGQSLMQGLLASSQIDKNLAEAQQVRQNTVNLNTANELQELQIIAQGYSNAKSREEAQVWSDVMRSRLANLDSSTIKNRADAEYVDQQRFQFEALRPLVLQQKEAEVQHTLLNNDSLRFNNKTLNPLMARRIASEITFNATKSQGQSLENVITSTLISEGVNLRGDALERVVFNIIQNLDVDGLPSWLAPVLKPVVNAARGIGGKSKAVKAVGSLIRK